MLFTWPSLLVVTRMDSPFIMFPAALSNLAARLSPVASLLTSVVTISIV